MCKNKEKQFGIPLITITNIGSEHNLCHYLNNKDKNVCIRLLQSTENDFF